MDILMTEVADSGCALLLVTHDPELAAAVTDHSLRLDATAAGDDDGRRPTHLLLSDPTQPA